MAVFLVRQPRCVFIHIPKTGGASIRHGFFEGKVAGPKQGFVPEPWQKLFKFAFVRNPYDRLVSAWKMFSGGMEKTVWQRPDDQHGIPLDQFLKIAQDENVAYSGKREATPEKIRHHAIPQTHPFNCLQYADFIGRFETLEKDFAEICGRLEIPFEGLPHWNKTQRETDYMQYFDDQTRRMTEEFYADDFAQLGYDLAHQLHSDSSGD